MNGIIIFKGRYGTTRQYAQWISEELNLAYFATTELDEGNLSYFDFIIIGSSVYTGKLKISQWLQTNLKALRGKQIFFFQVAGTSPLEKEKLNTYFRQGVPEEIRAQCKIYYYPGKMLFNELSWKDRFKLRMGARLTKDLVKKKSMLTGYNLVKKENIRDLVNAVKKFCSVKNKSEHSVPSRVVL
ncbi:MAG: flavodoxin domain-containing protein [Chitinophagaceae bacterium]